MNTQQATELFRACLREIAPEADLDRVPADADYRELLSLDSLDFLQLVELLSERGQVRIDEEDYPRLATVAMAIDFLAGPSHITAAASDPRP